MANVLIIDDDSDVGRVLALSLAGMGHAAVHAQTLTEGLREVESGAFDVVLLDVRLPDGDGLTGLPRIREAGSAPEVIIVTGAGTVDGAEMAIKNGAWDYLQKPLSSEMIQLALARVLQYRESKGRRRQALVALKTRGIVGSSRPIRACLDIVAQAANSEASVMITGETGTGKELFAKAIHCNSPRSQNSFVVVDCAALPQTLVESSLFGHVRGAYTGADQSVDGLVKQADGGTLFLDEIGELDLSIQKAFLRVLQEKRFRPVGGKQEVCSDFRLVAVTNKDLELLAAKGLFREDLLFRLRSISLELPPLRQRLEDIKELAVYHMARICERYGMETKGLSTDFIGALQAYEWPGNVRELVKVLEGAISQAFHAPILFPKHLPDRIRINMLRSSLAGNQQEEQRPAGVVSPDLRSPAGLPAYRNFREAALAEAECKYFKELIATARGDLKLACKISGLGRTRLYSLLKKNHISRFGWS